MLRRKVVGASAFLLTLLAAQMASAQVDERAERERVLREYNEDLERREQEARDYWLDTFADEPRDEVWASASEASLSNALAVLHEDGVKPIAEPVIECRRSLCRFDWQSTDGDSFVSVLDLLERSVVWGAAIVWTDGPDENGVYHSNWIFYLEPRAERERRLGLSD